MCGITGFWQAPADERALSQTVGCMNETLRHRGPDDGGTWVDAGCGLALASRRLAILDLSEAGHQPMLSACGRYAIAYNGEVYNFAEIRKELEAEGIAFRGRSDTEAILEGCARWGIEKTLERLNGMFAIALWDRKTRTLTLVRDRLGIKPLYYGLCNGALLFGSELKALCKYPGFEPNIDRNSLALFFRHNYIPAPYSIYKGVYKLPPGCLLNVSSPDELATPTPYWSAKTVAESGVNRPLALDEAEAVQQLEALLRDAVRLRMISDVPLGAFLSGGIDSSTVVALMQAQSERPIKTFSIGFHEATYNEATHAKAVACHLGTEHTELYVSSKQAQDVIPNLATMYDEPFADSSQIPTFLVSQLTRQHVTVSLSGDGGDELFAGYNRYTLGNSVWNRVKWMPSPLRRVGSKGIHSVSPANWDRFFAHAERWLPSRFKVRLPGDKLYKLSSLLEARSPQMMYHHLVSHWKSPENLVADACEPPTALTDRAVWPQVDGFTHHMMYLDLITYLPDDILTKVDRASMAVSLEARVPLLDHRVVEWAWRLPLSLKIKHNQSKWLLRQVLYQHVPKKLIERPKMGFGVPIDAWLRGPLRAWAEDLLSETRLRREGFLNPEPVRQKWAEHLSGRRNWQYLLWDVLMFQAWRSRWLQ